MTKHPKRLFFSMLKDKEAQPLPAAFIVNDVQFQRRKWGYPQTAHSCNQEIFLRKTQKLFLPLTDTGLTESCLKRGLQNHLGSLWWTSKLLIFICEKGVPLNKQQKHEVASSYFLGNIWKRIQGTLGYTLEPVLLSSGGGEVNLECAPGLYNMVATLQHIDVVL